MLDKKLFDVHKALLCAFLPINLDLLKIQISKKKCLKNVQPLNLEHLDSGNNGPGRISGYLSGKPVILLYQPLNPVF